MVTRVTKQTFGAVTFDTGTIPAGLPAALAPWPILLHSDSLNAWMGSKSHNDEFAINAAGLPALVDGKHFATSDYIDMRDLIENQECLDDIVINVQRQQELPYASLCWNLPPVNAMYETLIISQEPIILDPLPGSTEIVSLEDLHSIGFNPIGTYDTGPGSYVYQEVRSDAIVYVETRKYALDASQQWSSPQQMGQMNGPPPGDTNESETRWTSDFAMVQRTVRGNPDLIVGPGLHVIRVWSMWNADRASQTAVGDPATDQVAKEYAFNSMRLGITIPALQVNIIGNQRKMSATEQAVWYSNILLG